MQLFLEASNVLLPVAYLIATVAYGDLFFSDPGRSGRLAAPWLRATLFLHLAALVVLTARWRQLPAVTVSQVLSLIALAVAAVYLFVEWRSREKATGFWLVSLAFLFQLLASLLRDSPPPNRELFHDPLFGLHVTLALLGYAAFVVAAGYGFLFLMLYRDLKAGRFTTFFGKLPPLETLGNMLAGATKIGFASLAGAIGLGVFWAERRGQGWLADPQILATIAVWLFYGGVLLLRRSGRWQGRHLAVASLIGFTAILGTLLAVRMFMVDFHGAL
ncbi:MAG: cytochrome c biogenesis protein CcsA [Acidobacteriota bacterium]